jgi:hypothetical protein
MRSTEFERWELKSTITAAATQLEGTGIYVIVHIILLLIYVRVELFGTTRSMQCLAKNRAISTSTDAWDLLSCQNTEC